MAVSQKRPLDDTVLSTKHILMDIEGTTTSISFVKDTLFPYVRKHLDAYLDAHWNEDEFQSVLTLLKDQAIEDKKANFEGALEIPSEGSEKDIQVAVVKNVLWQMDLDRKTTALKKLQGHMWREGYKNGDLKGHLFADVAPALREWVKDGRKLYIYSSGSVEAQKLLFGNSAEGDLMELFSDFFDTEVGPKVEAGSYKAIVERLQCNADDVLFLTDMLKEASAAREAGLPVILVEREGNEPIASELLKEFSSVSSFGDLSFEVAIKKQKVAEEADTPSQLNGQETQLHEAKEPSASEVLDVKAHAMDIDEPTNPALSSSTDSSDKITKAVNQVDAADATASNIESVVETEIVQVKPKDEQSTNTTAKDATSTAINPEESLVSTVDVQPHELKADSESSTEVNIPNVIEKAVGETVIEKSEDGDKTALLESETSSVKESKTDKTSESEALVSTEDDAVKAESDEKVTKEPLLEENKNVTEVVGEGDLKTASAETTADPSKTEEIKKSEETDSQKSEKETEASSVETEIKKPDADKANETENKNEKETDKKENGTTNGTTNGACNGSANGTSNGNSTCEIKELEEDDVKKGHNKVNEDISEVIVAKNVPQVEDAGLPIEA